jgi:hypothetical protein
VRSSPSRAIFLSFLTALDGRAAALECSHAQLMIVELVCPDLTKPNETESTALPMRNRKGSHNPITIQFGIVLTPINHHP